MYTEEDRGEMGIFEGYMEWDTDLAVAIGLEVEYRQFLQSSPELTRTPTREQWFRCEF